MRTSDLSRVRLHATCVALDDTGILLRGPSGSGKSDLALRMIDAGAELVADDQVELAAGGGRLVASAPAALAGRMEVRGLGIVSACRVRACVRVRLVVDLVAPARVERLPDPATTTLVGITMPLLLLAPFELSAVAKLRLAARLHRPDTPARSEGSGSA